jgi:hypothetical protein
MLNMNLTAQQLQLDTFHLQELMYIQLLLVPLVLFMALNTEEQIKLF